MTVEIKTQTPKPPQPNLTPGAVTYAPESKPDKFIRLAEQRTNKAINQIHALGDLSNTAIYDYTPEQVIKIRVAITEALQLATDRLNGLEPKQFTLKG